jgi:hypothetical protein
MIDLSALRLTVLAVISGFSDRNRSRHLPFHGKCMFRKKMDVPQTAVQRSLATSP